MNTLIYWTLYVISMIGVFWFSYAFSYALLELMQ